MQVERNEARFRLPRRSRVHGNFESDEAICMAAKGIGINCRVRTRNKLGLSTHKLGGETIYATFLPAGLKSLSINQ